MWDSHVDPTYDPCYCKAIEEADAAGVPSCWNG